jgi:hypothetical protein
VPLHLFLEAFGQQVVGARDQLNQTLFRLVVVLLMMRCAHSRGAPSI